MMRYREQVSFSTNAKLEKLIGRELITNNVIAIFELIKNSYDAFADKVTIQFLGFTSYGDDESLKKNSNKVISTSQSKIIISDNGKGMSFKEIKDNWMEIGTTSKEGQYELSNDINNETRQVNGEKGIGRFGVDKLGERVKLISIGAKGKEKVELYIDWNKFNDYGKTIQEIAFDCDIEELQFTQNTGLTLEISNLRDDWTGVEVLKLKRQLKKLVSPFSQEMDKFRIYIDFNNDYKELIINDSLDYANIGIDASIDKDGIMEYDIFTSIEGESKTVQLSPPGYGPIKLKILYMDRAAKASFTRKTGMSTKDYGNIKLFRDNFRVLPYGERENDWLGIDNVHSQGTFRTFGTRDLVGYVQISKKENSILKDATSRQGLNEDIREFEEFKIFIWKCINLLTDFYFRRLKIESQKQGEVIKENVKEIQQEINKFEREIPLLYKDMAISENDKIKLIEKTKQTIDVINFNIQQVHQANQQLTNRVKVMEKIVGAETRMYDMLHAVKNRLASLEALVVRVDSDAKGFGIRFDRSFADKILSDISNMVLAAMRRSSPVRKKRDTIILSEFIEEFIADNKKIYPEIDFEFISKNYQRVFINVEELKISLENMLDNSIKAMKNENNKRIKIYIDHDDKWLKMYFEDNGGGVDKADAPFIFNVSFTRTNGSGIGLSSVLDFMKEEGGDINLVEKGTLKGASFELVFPIKGVV